MPWNLIIKEQVYTDVISAYDYYEKQENGLGERFLQVLFDRYRDLCTHPNAYSFLSGDARNTLRDVMLEPFPYIAIFEISSEDVILYTIHNTYRQYNINILRR